LLSAFGKKRIKIKSKIKIKKKSMHTSLIPADTNGTPFLQFPNLSGVPGLRHGIFTRKGGVSPSPFDSLNIGLGVGDTPENVERNRRRVARCLSAHRLIFAHQVHGTDVLTIGDDHGPGTRLTGDALITDRPGIFIAVQVADCQPVLLFDPVKGAAAAVHSGWRGSVENVIGQTVAAMEKAYGSNPENILAGIGPSLGPCCGEFINYRDELPGHFWKYGDDNNRFDFWAISRDQLTACGVKGDNIHLSRLCTKCRTDLFFSYRGETDTGRFTAVIGRVQQ
jgi:YfiH family protein